MAYTLNVGYCDCENNVVDKTSSLHLGQDISCVMVNTDSLNPIFKVDGTRSNVNYCYCSEFGKWYFVESVEALAGGHCLYHCHVDVLHTYRTQIKGLTCLVARNEDINKWKRDIHDEMIPIKANKGCRWKPFSGADSVITNDVCYVLGMI
ncbi:MAG: hypothetical protein J6R06_06540 [Bacteroidales bacterium]|nr:hypothetical protein [Bacteroidales bacterium]